MIMTAGGCQHDEPSVPLPTAAPPSAPAPSPSQDPDRAAAEAAVLKVYDEYRRVVDAAQGKGDPKAGDLATYVAEPLLGQTRHNISSMAKAGFVIKGESSGTPAITSVDLQSRTPTAEIEDCIDARSRVAVNKKTGKPQPAPSGQPEKYLVVSTAKEVSGRWYIDGTKGYWDRPC